MRFKSPALRVSFLKSLEDFFHLYVIRKGITSKTYFQQDGASPHFATETRRLLKKFKKQSGGFIEWTARSPNLKELEFFLWGYTKQKMYKVSIQEIADFRKRITKFIKSIQKCCIKNSFFLIFQKRLELVIKT